MDQFNRLKIAGLPMYAIMFYLINPIVISIYVIDVSNNNKIEVFLEINQLTV